MYCKLYTVLPVPFCSRSRRASQKNETLTMCKRSGSWD